MSSVRTRAWVLCIICGVASGCRGSSAKPADGGADQPIAADVAVDISGPDAAADDSDLDGSSTDVPQGCNENARACLGRRPATCGDAGIWNASDLCSDDTPACFAGVCGSRAMVAAGGVHTCALLDDGTVRCWGDNTVGQLGVSGASNTMTPAPSVDLGAKAVSISMAGLHSCAALETNGVDCWGDNAAGELGTGDQVFHPTPVAPSGSLSNVIAVATGADHTCVIDPAGGLSCWGRDIGGPIAGDSTTQLVPVNVPIESPVLAIAAGDQRTVALSYGGRVYALGKLTSSSYSGMMPRALNTPSAAVAVAAGGYQACAILDGGDLRCWGNDSNNSTINLFAGDPPQAVSLPGKAIAVAVGGQFTCAVLESGDLSCWGDNYSGQLGLGHTRAQPTPSPPISVGGKAIAVTAGYRHTCVLLEDRAIKCWGDNSAGQLGLGDRRSRGGTPDTVPAALPAVLFQ
jgi:Regulator of chromosome condensation (RCC1) repeat